MNHYYSYKELKGRLNVITERTLENKKRNAEKLKETFKVIKENIGLLKDKIIQENQQKRKVIQIKGSIDKHSIEFYSERKMSFYKKANHEVYLKLKNEAKRKEYELQMLRNSQREYEKTK